jgi:hypothetical protein
MKWVELQRMSIDELIDEKAKYQGYIDGPENDGRVTSDGSASLDYWMDMVDDVSEEIASRGKVGA